MQSLESVEHQSEDRVNSNAPTMPPAEDTNQPATTCPETSNKSTESLICASRKIRWRWGVLAAIAMALLSLYPQIDLWITRGAEWHRSYASMFYDEEMFAAYIHGLTLGRTRRTLPLQADAAKPQFESDLSIQVVPSYLLFFAARATGLTISQIMILLTPLIAYAATLVIFYLLALTTGDERLAAVGALAILILGTPASRDTVLLKWLLGWRVASGFLLFLRRYQPGIAFPIFFGYMSLTWHAFTTDGRKAWYAAITAGAVFALLVFSYFYLWTAALAWLGCLVLLWLAMRRADWRMVAERLAAMAVFAIPASAIYAVMLAHRYPVTDEVQMRAFTHTPDVSRAPEWLGVIAIVLLIWGARKRRVEWRQPLALFATSVAFTPLAVFNQQIITGLSLQPRHYEEFVANYLSLLALVLVIALLWRGREQVLMPRTRSLALASVAGVALCWGVIGTNYMTREHRWRNVERDRFVRVAKRLTSLAAEHGVGTDERELVFSPDINIVSDNVAVFAPQAPFWGTNAAYGRAGLSRKEQEERYFQYLYYGGLKPDALERLLDAKESTAVVALFGGGRYWPELTMDFKPLTKDEIRDKVREYADYVANFNQERALHPRLSYVVVYTDAPFSFSNIDRWYNHDIGELIGPFTLYQVEPLNR